MLIELVEVGYDMLEIVEQLPGYMENFVIAPAKAFYLKGVASEALCQQFAGEGFSAWFSRYWITQPVSIHSRADLHTLELRIAIKDSIEGTWENISNPALRPWTFQLAYVPHVLTRAAFMRRTEYQTFDIHFDPSFLQEIGVEYRMLDAFLEKVFHHEASELVRHPVACSTAMMQDIDRILHNQFTMAGKAMYLRNTISNILIEALEIAGKEAIDKLALSPTDTKALYRVRDLIIEHCPKYLGSDVLVRETGLNKFKLSFGFKRLFHTRPYELFLDCRFRMAMELLKTGGTVAEVAYQLEYESANGFIRAFRKKFKGTPKQFQLRG